MNRKIALKRLSASDLTLFESHFRQTSGTKQKAINMDAAVFVKEFYPGLRDIDDEKLYLQLIIYGPGGVGPYEVTRKALKQQKNWRVNGELIWGPECDANRYSVLKKGDYAIFDFIGDDRPREIRMYLIAKNEERDHNLYRIISEKYEERFSPHRGMIPIDELDLEGIVQDAQIDMEHSLLDMIDSGVLEEASFGSQEATELLRKRRKGRSVSKEELARAREGADKIGRLGEEIMDRWFSSNKASYVWVSNVDAVSPYDFELDEHDGQRRIDVKSTSHDFSAVLHISSAELVTMADYDVPYDIYRLYRVRPGRAYLRIARDVNQFARDLLANLGGIPKGVAIDGISLQPDAGLLQFDEEIEIRVDE